MSNRFSSMTTNSLARLLKLHEESVSRDRVRTSLIDWATVAMSSTGLSPSAHHRALLAQLSAITTGEVRRLLVLMPPGSAKSTYVSVIYPIWWFIQHPRSSVIAVSHTASLVESFSRRIHAIVDEHHHKIGFNIRADDRSIARWKTDTGGEYVAVGIRGAITGLRADLVIIDDPIKSMGDAESLSRREYLWDWYTSELTTRLKPNARVVLVMTRWHEQDLGGAIIARGGADWNVLRLPAIAEINDPIRRPQGAPLWPEWENLKSLTEKQNLLGSRNWSALFQQSPLPSNGNLFSPALLRQAEDAPAHHSRTGRSVRAWDLASTSAGNGDDPDWTVGLKLRRDDSGAYVIEDVVRFRGNVRQVEDAILSTAHADGHSVAISLPIDPGQAGKSQVAHLTSILAGYRVYASRERGSKMSRATLVAGQFEVGNVSIPHGPWYEAFIDELTSFPRGPKDDQVDALSRAFITLLEFPTATRRLFVPFNSR
jgi:predicted phage terminase large subunit-like protein